MNKTVSLPIKFVAVVSATVALSVVSTGCATDGPAVIPPKPAKTSLKFFPADQSEAYLLGVTKGGQKNTASTLLEARSEQDVVKGEAIVASACRGGSAQKEAGFAALVIPYLIGKGVGFVVDQADQALQDELKKYTASFEGTDQGSLYISQPSNGPVLANACFRLSRRAAGGADRVAMDFVGKIEIRDSKWFVVTPLRLYYAETLAETDSSNAVGVSVAMKMAAVWREGNRGRSEDAVISTSLVSEKVAVDSQHPYFYKLYNVPAGTVTTGISTEPATGSAESEGKKEKVLPLPPWSVREQYPYDENWVTTSVSVSETGNPPWLLKNAAKLFHNNKDSIAKNLEAAADKAAGVSASQSASSASK